MNRHEQRKKIFQLLFQIDHDAVSIENASFYDLYNQQDYIKSTVDYFLNHKETVDNEISAHLKNYTLERISKVERNILRMAVSEINVADAPVRVIINEAVKVSKLYGENDSFRFVNGVLKNFADKNG